MAMEGVDQKAKDEALMPFTADCVGHPVVLGILTTKCLASFSWQSRSALYFFFWFWLKLSGLVITISQSPVKRARWNKAFLYLHIHQNWNSGPLMVYLTDEEPDLPSAKHGMLGYYSWSTKKTKDSIKKTNFKNTSGLFRRRNFRAH